MAEQTYNPITSSSAYENSFFAQIPIPIPGHAIVLTGDQGQALTIENNSIPEKKQIRKGKFNQMIQIDKQSHDICFEAELPSNNALFKYHISVSMMAQVYQPIQVIQNGITDVTASIKGFWLPQIEDAASHSTMEETQNLRTALLSDLRGITKFSFGIEVANVRIQLLPDPAYIEQQKSLQKLRNKKELETVRSDIANDLSKLYESPVTRVFAEFASEHITAEEAAERLNINASKDFDESMRRANEFLDMFKKAQDMGAVSPDVLDAKANELFSAMLTQVAPTFSATPTLTEGTQESTVYAPPDEDYDD